MKEMNFNATNNIVVKYKHKKSKYDFNHVIFVFSGFLNASPGNYDFSNALNDCPCDIIWINDEFEKMYTYYMCINMDFKVEEAITEFIYSKISELGLNKNQATLTGFSKGGSAALYYGLKLNFSNIVVSVPQMKIGSYIENNWKQVASHMMGKNYTIVDKNYLDNILYKLLCQDTFLSRNIYLLTSEKDVQYSTEIVPYLSFFQKYTNFNLLKTHSAFVREHNQVTSHHVPLLLSIYYALATDAIPTYSGGEVNFFGRLLFSDKNPTNEMVIDLRVAKIINSHLFLEGVSFLQGNDLIEYSDVNYYLVLKLGESNIKLDLAKAHRPALTREFFNGKSLTIYDKAWFTTYQYKGIDISVLPKGKYQLSLGIQLSKGLSKVSVLKDSRNIVRTDTENKYKLLSENNILYLEIL
ncbi:accessory Sec system protein Asp2 [Actinobacillus suis]|uniref:Accessory Sec system protein Asp2 n=3 Tax=Actinobacillus suis TaxID=716 RepID=K0FZX3_ACTSU|nr:accessory Sec system protein Asp2 [Actinobacillus suis]AAO65493.1 unknown [Actinobacillus suis]ABU23736.1 unknown [Actinobacillus suis H91-0380]ABW09314.1 unknown [Actinobacillus suis]AFU20147.1 hypothetical protein ASU2_10095 [Actinobacillus suis H91-0380]AIJ32283.1 hypothetical protein ASU1_10140 [Actinobacillus suis ATCC 33415]